ncbi:MAG: UDP-N-acetylmuramate--L-alanine ligase [Lachnospiraceae bacterium]|nr:UDP-N-acetylmuramate--L-alanine ligase [Lachnospiraceae bacterium]
MYQINFNHPIWVHFIGIGGISMSGLASVLLKAGFRVSGSDSAASALTRQLEENGARIMLGQRAGNIEPGMDLVVYTAAIHPDNPEFEAAVSAGIPMMTRAQLLGEIMANYKLSVAVSGTHGKTTTTSMLSCMTMEAGLDPTISVGGILKAIGGNIRVGSSQVFITEACEYTNSFLSLRPYISIILNIDADHLDFFKDLDDIRHSFRTFAGLTASEGTLVIHAGIPDLEGFTQGLACRVITFSEGPLVPSNDPADYPAGVIHHYHPEHIVFNELGFASFDAYRDDVCIGHFDLSVPGMHNVTNACAAIAACDALGADMPAMRRGLTAFTGTDRRFELKGEKNGIRVIDDYAHHPTEIKATLKAAARYPGNEIWCVFQPHTYTRTQALLDEFAEALSHADHVILADIYAAREINTIGISSEDLAEKLRERGADAIYLPSFEAIKNHLRAHARSGDLIMTVGAGNIYQVGEDFLK